MACSYFHLTEKHSKLFVMFAYTKTKTRCFRVRLAGFMNLKKISLDVKWPILT